MVQDATEETGLPAGYIRLYCCTYIFQHSQDQHTQTFSESHNDLNSLSSLS